MPFSLTANPSLNEISDAINYLLNNFGSNVSIDLTTGIIAGPSGRISNLYKYISIKYATSYDGTVGFSNVPTGATYYGIRNSNETTESTNPVDYIWYKTTGFGTTNYLWYIVAGGRQIDFYVSSTQPTQYYVKDPGTVIDIDIVTTTSTINTTIASIYKWTSGSAPARPTTTSTYTWATGSYSAPSGWSTTPTTDTTSGDVQWAIFIPISANTNITTSTLDWTNTSYPIVQFSSNGTPGASANQNAIVYLYQWANSTPGNPNSTSTFTWSTGVNSSYTGSNGWLTYIPTNPGTPNTYLWQASKSISDVPTATTTTVNWSSGFLVSSISQNGATGSPGATGATGNKSATASVYQWALSTPSISGSSTYTWSSSSFTPNPSGWSKTITSAPSSGYYLYTATVSFSDSGTATTTTINWTLSSIVVSGYASINGTNGTNGASSRICYTRIPGSPSPISGNITTTGSSTFPTATQSNTTWGLNYAWYATDPNPSSTDSLFQANGIYDPSTGNTVWNTPYLSSLKVGELSAITVNAGQLTVSSPSTGSGFIKAGTANLSGTSMSGYGGILNQNGTFAFGNSTTNIAFDGSSIYLNGSVVATSNIQSNAVTVSSGVNLASDMTFTSNGTIFSFTINTGGAPLWLFADVYFMGNSPGNCDIQLLYNSTVLVTRSYIDIGGGTDVFSYYGTPSSGSNTYSLVVSNLAGGYNFTVQAKSNMVGIGFKR